MPSAGPRPRCILRASRRAPDASLQRARSGLPEIRAAGCRSEGAGPGRVPYLRGREPVRWGGCPETDRAVPVLAGSRFTPYRPEWDLLSLAEVGRRKRGVTYC
ncbi:hypothetical protein GCM10027440_31000 [Nocardiopsis coralliicola]